MPKIDSFLKLPRQGRSDNRGYKEADFINHLKSSDLNVGIDDNCHLMVPGRRSPYEPDIVLFDKSLGLFVDVEIDEPYDGYLRIETHNIESSDDIRNGFFCESGWVVVRFTEHQVHINPDGCVKFIKSVLCGLKEGVVNKVKEYAINKGYETNLVDGVRIEYSDGFALIRKSNTSPAITLRFEAKSQEVLDSRQKEYMDLVNKLI